LRVLVIFGDTELRSKSDLIKIRTLNLLGIVQDTEQKHGSRNVSAYQHFIDCCHTLGIPGARDSIDKMLAVDFIIANEDRHFNNFGAVRNADTLELCYGLEKRTEMLAQYIKGQRTRSDKGRER
jgi:hypothetical protein